MTKGVPLLFIGVAAIVAVIVYISLNPEILRDLAWIAMIVIVAIVAIAVILFAVMTILAIPFYFRKGEQYQEGVSYNLKDVKPVKDTSDREKEEE